MKYNTTIIRDSKEIDISVSYDYTPASKGSFDSCMGVKNAGAQLEPNTPESIDIIYAININMGVEIELTDCEIDKITQELFDAIGE